MWIDNLHLSLQFARLCDDINEPKLPLLLDELDRTGMKSSGIGELKVKKSTYDLWSDIGPRCESIEQQCSGFAGEAAYYSILLYISAELHSQHPLTTSKRSNQALLNCALLPKPNVEREFQCT